MVKKFLNNTVAVELVDTYKGYKYLITMSIHGYRCGFVCITPDSSFYDIACKHQDKYESYDDLDISCFGGITFISRNEITQSYSLNDDDIWIGFDCAHYGTGCDYDAVLEYFGIKPYLPNYTLILGGEPKYIGFVEIHCKYIIDQLVFKDKEMNPYE